jgi:hypothetical protein
MRAIHVIVSIVFAVVGVYLLLTDRELAILAPLPHFGTTENRKDLTGRERNRTLEGAKRLVEDAKQAADGRASDGGPDPGARYPAVWRTDQRTGAEEANCDRCATRMRSRIFSAGEMA